MGFAEGTYGLITADNAEHIVVVEDHVGNKTTYTVTVMKNYTVTYKADGETVSTEAGTVSVTLDSTSTWTLTGDSYVTEFNGDAANVVSNGYTLYVNGTALTGTK